ncbi:MAG: T9SS type A sorting domain-containing protein [Bacteroidota bacterium]
MQKQIIIFVLLFLGSQMLLGQANVYHLGFSDGTKTPTTFCVDIDASFNVNKKLGSSNLMFDFDPLVLDNPVVSSTPLDVATNYYGLSLTTPQQGQASLNVVLKLPGAGNGHDFSTSPAAIARVCFDVLDQTQPIELNWLENSSFQTVVFDDNNTASSPTQLVSGILENFNQTSFPVSWLSFEAEMGEFDALLKWETGSEINNDRFEVERATEGGDFVVIGEVKGVGNSVLVNSYTFVDKDVKQYKSDKLVYRIKQVDFDGTFSYSQRVEIQLDQRVQLLAEAYPNVFDASLKINYQSTTFEEIKLRIVNELGQDVFKTTNTAFQYAYEIPTEDWPRGIYVVFLASGNLHQEFKVQKQ